MCKFQKFKLFKSWNDLLVCHLLKQASKSFAEYSIWRSTFRHLKHHHHHKHTQFQTPHFNKKWDMPQNLRRLHETSSRFKHSSSNLHHSLRMLFCEPANVSGEQVSMNKKKLEYFTDVDTWDIIFGDVEEYFVMCSWMNDNYGWKCGLKLKMDELFIKISNDFFLQKTKQNKQDGKNLCWFVLKILIVKY